LRRFKGNGVSLNPRGEYRAKRRFLLPESSDDEVALISAMDDEYLGPLFAAEQPLIPVMGDEWWAPRVLNGNFIVRSNTRS
jgi:hypothetical protein